MILKNVAISAILLTSFAISSVALAFDRDRSSIREMNNDREFRDSQFDSRTQTGNGFRLREIVSGSPNPSDRVFMNYLYYNDMTRNHR